MKQELSKDKKKALLEKLLQEKMKKGRLNAEPQQLTPDRESRYQSFPVTAIQRAYIAGRSEDFELGATSCHSYFEIEQNNLDIEKLKKSLNKTIARHEMLRAKLATDDTQIILEKVAEVDIPLLDITHLTEVEQDEKLLEIRETLSTQCLDPKQWPVYDVRVTKYKNTHRIHIDFDLLFIDAASLAVVLSTWAAAYNDSDSIGEPESLSFRDYVIAEQARVGSREYKQAEAYWKKRLEDLPAAPNLPLAKHLSEINCPRFVRRKAYVSQERWQKLQARAKQQGVTPTAFLCTVFGELLAYFGKSRRFSLIQTLFNRLPFHQDVNTLVGEFTTTSILEVDVSGENFSERLQTIQERMAGDLSHLEYEGMRVLRDINLASGEMYAATMPVVFTSILGVKRDIATLTDWLGSLVYGTSQTPQVMWDHQVFEEGGQLAFNWDTVDELFPEGLVQTMLDVYVNLLNQLADNEELWSEEILPLFPEEQSAARLAYNKTEAARPDSAILHHAFEDAAQKYPHNTALIFPSGSLSFQEIDQRANQLAHLLIEKGVKANTLIPVYAHKGWEQVIAVLGVVKAGAAYLPVAANLPEERARYLLERSALNIILTQSHAEEVAWAREDFCCIDIDNPEQLNSFSQEKPQRDILPDHLAYVIFTSGSTGLPKGVMIDHQGASNTCIDVVQRFDINEKDKVLALASLSFDLSVFDIFGVLGAGGTMVFPESPKAQEPEHWLELVKQHEVSIWNTVPAMLDMLVDFAESQQESVNPLRIAMLSGDWIPVTLPDRARAIAEDFHIHSLGGATEASIWSITYPIENVDPEWNSIPYGYPMENQRFYVLDAQLRDCAEWVPGELYIGGRGVALGYLDDLAKTSAHFFIHPKTGERLYRTGDMGYFRPEGFIEFLGREDFQVKIRGFRIELGEIETALLNHPGVQNAVVIAVGDPKNSRQLVAYTVNDTRANETALRAYLADTIPEYMIPSVFVSLDTLPLTQNAKVDRSRLPMPWEVQSFDAEKMGESSERETELRLWLVKNFAKQLGVNNDDIDIFTPLTHYGVDSLTGLRLANELSEYAGVHVKVRMVWENNNIAALARTVAGMSPQAQSDDVDALELPQITPNCTEENKPFELNDVQQAYWLGRGDNFELGSIACHIYAEFERDDLDLQRLQKAWQQLVKRHGMLRGVVDDNGQQTILAEVPDYNITTRDLSECSEQERESQLMLVRDRMSHQMFDTTQWPLFAIEASVLPNGRKRLHIGFDLLIADVWSFLILVDEWHQLYQNAEQSLPPLRLSFRDYLLAEQQLQSTPQFENSLAYWQERVKTMPLAPKLPLAKDASQIETPHFKRRKITFAKSSWQAFCAQAQSVGVTPSLALCTAYARILQQWSAEKAFTLNLTLFNRMAMHEDVNGLVGDFTSLSLLEVAHEKGATISDQALAMQSQLWQDLEHRQVNGVRVLGEWRKALGGPVSAPIVFTSAVGLSDGLSDKETMSEAWLGERVFDISQTPQVWLDHQVVEHEGGVILSWDSVDELFPEGLLDDMFAAYTNLLDQLATDKNIWRASGLQLTSEKDLTLRNNINATQTDIPSGLLHGALVQQAQKQPEAIALITPEKQLTYQALSQSANKIAHGLQAQGLKTGELVAIVMHKGWEQVVAACAILEAGGVYVPVDASLPNERIEHILASCEVQFVLSQSAAIEAVVFPQKLKVFALDEDPFAEYSAEALVQTRQAQELAYVIFTSGSTGLPKGVMIDHRGALNTCVDINKRFSVNHEDVIFGISSLSFDLSVYDIFGAIQAGACLVIPSSEGTRDPSHWCELMQAHKVSVWNSAPPLMGILQEYQKATDVELPLPLRLVMLSGDWIPLAMAQSFCEKDGVQFTSLGGATEASIWSIIYPVDQIEAHWRSVPYGKPMFNQSFHVLDNELSPRPTWVPGDLYIGGIGLALGYWKDEKLSEAKFITHPQTGERLYATGDLGRYLPDGNIEFIGRADFQVKIQGHRIELGEIESTLEKHDEVQQSLVIAYGPEKGDRQLVAYVVLSENVEQCEDRLNEILGKQLPSYMLPKTYVFMPALPLTANGKVDRKALPEPSMKEKTHKAPSTPLERAIAEVWQQELGISEISVDESFFDIGGYSQLAVRIVMQMQERLKCSIPIRTLFEIPTIEKLAQHLSGDIAKQERKSVDAKQRYAQYARRGIGERISAVNVDKHYIRASGNTIVYQNENGEEVEVLDMVGGYGSAILGHNHPEITQLAIDMLQDNQVVHAQHSNNYAAGELCERLSHLLHEHVGEAFISTLASTGTEAVEAAIKHAKMAYRTRTTQWLQDLDNLASILIDSSKKNTLAIAEQSQHLARGTFGIEADSVESLYRAIEKHNKAVLDEEPRFIALDHAFHGMTSGALTLTASPDFKAPFYWQGIRCDRIVADAESLQQQVANHKRCLWTLATNCDGQVVISPRDHYVVAATIVEAIQGEGGIYSLTKGFIDALRLLSVEAEFPIIVDEIQSGMGRSGYFTASESMSLKGDYYVFSKSLGGGIAKVSAMAVRESKYEADFGYVHGSTFAEDTPGCKLAIKTLDILEKDNLLERCQLMGARFKEKLQGLVDKYPNVIKEVRGQGLMLGLEIHSQIDSPSMMLRGMARNDPGTLTQLIAGYLLNEKNIRIAPTKTRSTIRFLPSAYINDEEIDQLITAFDEVCEIIHKVNLGRLLKFIVSDGNESSKEIKDWRNAYPPVQDDEPGDEPRVAMIGHVEDHETMLMAEPSFAELSFDQREALAVRLLTHFEPGVGMRKRITTATGEHVHLSVIGLPLTAVMFERMMRGSAEERDLLLDKIAASMDVAEEIGCSMVGFGGYTSIVTLNCTTVANTRLPVTSGNALTVALGIQGAMSAAQDKGVVMRDATVGIVGAKGNIGSIAARILAEESSRVILLGRNLEDEKFREVAYRIYEDAWQSIREQSNQKSATGLQGIAAKLATVINDIDPPSDQTLGEYLMTKADEALGEGALVLLTDDMMSLGDCNLIISSTNASEPVIGPMHLSERVAVIGDIAIPKDVDDSVKTLFPDINVISGGIAKLPNESGFQLSGSRLPEDHLFGCVAETTLLGVDGVAENFSFGEMTKSQVDFIRALAKKHGYSVGWV